MRTPRSVSTYWAENNKGRAEIYVSDDGVMVEFFDDRGHLFRTSEYPNKSLTQVQNLVEDWALGYQVLYEGEA